MDIEPSYAAEAMASGDGGATGIGVPSGNELIICIVFNFDICISLCQLIIDNCSYSFGV